MLYVQTLIYQEDIYIYIIYQGNPAKSIEIQRFAKPGKAQPQLTAARSPRKLVYKSLLCGKTTSKKTGTSNFRVSQ